MSTIDDIVKKSKRLEHELKKMGGTGKGLGELISSLEDEIDSKIVRKMFFIVRIRNRAVHEHDFDLSAEKKERFDKYYNDIISNIDADTIRNKNTYSEYENFKASARTNNKEDLSDHSIMENIMGYYYGKHYGLYCIISNYSYNLFCMACNIFFI